MNINGTPRQRGWFYILRFANWDIPLPFGLQIFAFTEPPHFPRLWTVEIERGPASSGLTVYAGRGRLMVGLPARTRTA